MKIDTEIVAAKSNQNAPNTTPISLKLEAIDQAKCVVIYFYSVQGTVDLVLFPKTAQSSWHSVQQFACTSSIIHISLLNCKDCDLVSWCLGLSCSG